jgi:hypothetical protein
MGFTVCPATSVAAPVECVWELLVEPSRYDEWWDARIERIEPEGSATPGQLLSGKTTAFGRKWDVTLRVEAVHAEKHQIQLHVTLPLGTINHATITGISTGATSSSWASTGTMGRGCSSWGASWIGSASTRRARS